MDILIIKLGALGDVINTLPLAVLLKERLRARIHWLVAPLSHPLLVDHEAVHRTLLFDRSKGASAVRSVLGHLKTKRFDLVLDLQRILKSGFFCMVANGERKIGFDRRRCKEFTWLLPMERIPASDSKNHMLDQYLEFADFLNIPISPVQWRIKACDKRLSMLPVDFVALNIGATKPANRWTTEGFASLAKMTNEQFGLPCVLTGGKEDVCMAENIEALAGSVVMNLVGKTTLQELIGVLDSARVMVTCDTGPMHLAVALGKKVVALFGPSDPRRTGPYRGRVIHSDVSCAPCNRRTCASPDCMAAIRPEKVFGILSEEIGN